MLYQWTQRATCHSTSRRSAQAGPVRLIASFWGVLGGRPIAGRLAECRSARTTSYEPCTDASGLPPQHARQLNGAQIPGGCDNCDAYSCISASSWHHSTGWLPHRWRPHWSNRSRNRSRHSASTLIICRTSPSDLATRSRASTRSLASSPSNVSGGR